MASTIDYPNEICTVLFVGKCNWNCEFCYNTNLVLESDINFDKEFLKFNDSIIGTLSQLEIQGIFVNTDLFGKRFNNNLVWSGLRLSIKERKLVRYKNSCIKSNIHLRFAHYL